MTHCTHILRACLAVAIPLAAQTTVTYSLQPLQAFQAAYGGRLWKVALYSAQVCDRSSSAGVSVYSGLVRQLAEIDAHINVVDFGLSAVTAERAQSRTGLARMVNALKWAGAGTALGSAAGSRFGVSDAKAAKVALISAGASAVLQVADSLLAQQESAQLANLRDALTHMLQPDEILTTRPTGCAASRTFFGEYIPGFKPVSVMLQ